MVQQFVGRVPTPAGFDLFENVQKLWCPFDLSNDVAQESDSGELAIVLDGNGSLDLKALTDSVQALMLGDLQPGSDPGLCVAGPVPAAVVEFGRRAQRELVTQAEARRLAEAHGIRLLGLSGTQDGVIGALAAVGLAASGEDGRYVLVGRSRELAGMQPVEALLGAGITAVRTLEGEAVGSGLVAVDKLRPARRGGEPIAVVQWAGDHWLPLKLD